MLTTKPEEETLLSSLAGSLDPFVYHVLKCDENVFRGLILKQLHTYYPDVDDGDNEVIWRAPKIF